MLLFWAWYAAYLLLTALRLARIVNDWIGLWLDNVRGNNIQ